MVSSRLELSPKRKPKAKAHALFLPRSRGGERGQIQDTLLKEKVLQGEGWDFKSEVIAGTCTEFSEPLFEAVVNSV